MNDARGAGVLGGQQQKPDIAPREKTAMEIFVDDLQQQNEGVREAVRRLSCMRERVYGPRPQQADNETKTSSQPGIASRADREVSDLRAAVGALHEQITSLEQYI